MMVKAMKKPNKIDDFLLMGCADQSSYEADLAQSTWDDFSKGKTFSAQELQDIFAFDFSDIIPHMTWDQKLTKQ